MRKPATPADLGFTARDHQRLSQALAGAQQARVFRRLPAVLLIAHGLSVRKLRTDHRPEPAGNLPSG